MDENLFRSMVGGLIYLTHTRPDIALSVGIVSRFMHSPSKHHFGAAKRIMRYVAGTVDLGIWYYHVSSFKLIGFTDSDWAGCIEDRKSTSGYMFSLGSGAISWSSKKQASLIYLTHTRPDIALSVGIVSRFMHSPSKHHFGAAKRIMRYVAGTVDLGIWYYHVSSFKLIGFTDSDWAGCIEDRKSTSGYMFSLGSGAISWSSKKQATTALSSSEAEYMASTSSACQAIWLRRVLIDLGQEQFEELKFTVTTKQPLHCPRT